LGYYFYNREKSEVFFTRNGVFLEKQFLSRKDSGSKVQIEENWQVLDKGKLATLEVESYIAPKATNASEIFIKKISEIAMSCC
jgi:hypothetical protein